MRNNILILPLIFVSSCQLLNTRDTKSNWEVLQSSEDVDCTPWPQSSDELQIQSIDVIKNTGFLMRSQDRLGRTIHQFRSWNKDNVVSSEGKKLSWGHDAEFLGALTIAGTQYFTINRTVKGRSLIELRRPDTNVVAYTTKSLGSKIKGISIHPNAQGFWLVYKNIHQDISIDDLPARVMEISLDGKNKMIHREINDIKISPDVQAVSVNEAIFLMWVDNDKGKSKIKMSILQKGKRKFTVHEVGRDIPDRLESWTIGTYKDGVVLVFVSGDSLVWEDASLEIYAMDAVGNYEWDRSFPLENVHVGDPLLVSLDASSYIILPKWLDGESSLSLYEINDNEVTEEGYFGVFSEGTYHVNGFAASKGKDLFVIKRQPSGYTKKYSLCKIEQ